MPVSFPHPLACQCAAASGSLHWRTRPIGLFRNKSCAVMGLLVPLPTLQAPWAWAFPPGWVLKAQRPARGKMELGNSSGDCKWKSSAWGKHKAFSTSLKHTTDMVVSQVFLRSPSLSLESFTLLIPAPGEIMSLYQVWILEGESWVRTDLHIYAVLMAGFLTNSCISNNNSSFENKALLNILIWKRKFEQLPSQFSLTVLEAQGSPSCALRCLLRFMELAPATVFMGF